MWATTHVQRSCWLHLYCCPKQPMSRSNKHRVQHTNIKQYMLQYPRGSSKWPGGTVHLWLHERSMQTSRCFAVHHHALPSNVQWPGAEVQWHIEEDAEKTVVNNHSSGIVTSMPYFLRIEKFPKTLHTLHHLSWYMGGLLEGPYISFGNCWPMILWAWGDV